MFLLSSLLGVFYCKTRRFFVLLLILIAVTIIYGDFIVSVKMYKEISQ